MHDANHSLNICKQTGSFYLHVYLGMCDLVSPDIEGVKRFFPQTQFYRCNVSIMYKDEKLIY